MIDSIVFHVPKTAGTSVQNMFRNQLYSEKLSVRLDEIGVASYVPEVWQEKGCLIGHFGVADVERNSMLMEHFSIHGRFALALIRDPFYRLVSDYYHILRTPWHRRRESVHVLSVEEYVDQATPNAQSLQLAIQSITQEKILFVHDGPIQSKLLIVETDSFDTLLPNLLTQLTGKEMVPARRNVGEYPPADLPVPSAEFKSKHQKDYALLEFLRSHGGYFAGPDLSLK